MIERNLRDVTLRKYGSVFMDTFGFYPLTFFGAIGDNFTDNYANIQVAINESLKKGLKYIFVPEGIYQYTGNLLSVEEITFIGNSQFAKIVNGDKEIPIYQIGTQVPFEKGTFKIEGTIMTIPTKVGNPSEAILVIDNKAITVYDGLMLLNGSKVTEIPLTSETKITNIKLKKNGISISLYSDNVTIPMGQKPITDATGKEIEWRVR